jgi:hypothetical protein
MGGIECYWWEFWRRLRALTKQLPRPVALAGGFEVSTGGSALRMLKTRRGMTIFENSFYGTCDTKG